MHCARAIEQLHWVGGFGQSVAGDEREQGDGFSGSGGHFEEAVAFGVESALEFDHVGVLLRVDVVVREVYGYIFDLELHFHGGGDGYQPGEAAGVKRQK